MTYKGFEVYRCWREYGKDRVAVIGVDELDLKLEAGPERSIALCVMKACHEIDLWEAEFNRLKTNGYFEGRHEHGPGKESIHRGG